MPVRTLRSPSPVRPGRTGQSGRRRAAAVRPGHPAPTQRELAELAGTTQSAVARLESGRTSPSLEEVLRLIRLTGLDLRVEFVPYDDSDLRQAEPLADPTQRLERLLGVTARLRTLRAEVARAS